LKKSLINSIIAGSVLAVSFVLTKTFFKKFKTVNAIKKSIRIFKKNCDAKVDNVILKQDELKQENFIKPKNSSYSLSKNENSNIIEHIFDLDFPKCSIKGANPIISNDIIFIDIYTFADIFDITYVYNNEKNIIVVVYNDNTVTYNLKNNTVNGNTTSMAECAKIINNLPYIPVELTAKLLGFDVTFMQQDRALKISARKNNNENQEFYRIFK